MAASRDWREFNDAWRNPGPQRALGTKEPEPWIILAATICLTLAGAAGWFDDAGHVHGEGTVLRAADLSGAYLRNADLSGADLELTNFNGADLTGADLNYAHLRGTNLGRAKLSGASLAGADLTKAILSEADLTGVKRLQQDQLDRACGDENTKLPEDFTIPKCQRK